MSAAGFWGLRLRVLGVWGFGVWGFGFLGFERRTWGWKMSWRL